MAIKVAEALAIKNGDGEFAAKRISAPAIQIKPFNNDRRANGGTLRSKAIAMIFKSLFKMPFASRRGASLNMTPM